MSVTGGSKLGALKVRERAKDWLNAVNLHWAGVVVLALVNVYLLTQMGLAWRTANSDNAEALRQQQVQLKAAELAAKPLEGLDVKLTSASEDADRFYKQRLPVSYSEIASELGVLKTKTGVHLSRVNYSQPIKGTGQIAAAAPVAGSDEYGGKLTEVLMDASLTGDYRALVLFMNGLERDKVFFVINSVALTGQQTGQVSLRVRLTTYLRGVVPEDKIPKDAVEADSPAVPAKTAGGAE